MSKPHSQQSVKGPSVIWFLPFSDLRCSHLFLTHSARATLASLLCTCKCQTQSQYLRALALAALLPRMALPETPSWLSPSQIPSSLRLESLEEGLLHLPI